LTHFASAALAGWMVCAACDSGSGTRAETPRAQAPKPPAPKPSATFDGQLGDTRLRVPLADLAGRVKLAAGETFKLVELGRDASSSHHAVALLDREPLHRHDTHDLLVVVVEGEGEMLIGDYTRTIGTHSIVYVPRKTVHSMRNTGKKPVIGYVMFTPPFDGKDRVPVAR
jgi:mannose-6-phosphate isomerase-like protein (cupin superfamily)